MCKHLQTVDILVALSGFARICQGLTGFVGISSEAKRWVLNNVVDIAKIGIALQV